MEGSAAYGPSSAPSDTAVSNATFSGTAPTGTAWANTTYTCSGSGCSLSPDTTYFIVATHTGGGMHSWAYALTNTESTYPSDSGWDIRFGHSKNTTTAETRTWESFSDWHPIQIDFTNNPTLTASSIGATTATLTIANHDGNWYYKYTSPNGGTCSSAQSGATADVDSLNAATTYTFKAYSDSTCSTLVATAANFTTLSFVTNLTSTKGTVDNLISSTAKKAVAFTTGSNANGYTLKNVTVTLRNRNARDGTIELNLHPMVGSTYTSASVPSDTAVASTTLTIAGTAPGSA